MRRLPFVSAAILFGIVNVMRQTSSGVYVWNDAVCAIFFVGSIMCAVFAIAIRDNLKGD